MVKASKAVGQLAVLGLLAFSAWEMFGSSPPVASAPATSQPADTEAASASDPSHIISAKSPEQQVVDDDLARYRIAVESGTFRDICVQAGMVKAAMLEAHDQNGYATWTHQEHSACLHTTYFGDSTIQQYAESSDREIKCPHEYVSGVDVGETTDMRRCKEIHHGKAQQIIDDMKKDLLAPVPPPSN